MRSRKKKAQIWYTDFMAGVLIFVIIIFIYYSFAHSVNQDPSKITSGILMDAKAISSSLVTRGSPENWTGENVEVIGLTDGNQRLVPEKLERFSEMDYPDTKTKLRTSYEYYVFLEDKDGNRILTNSTEGIGKKPEDQDNLVPVRRVLIYDSELVSMVVQVWN